ncbi:unnamed protein product [Symbiodinium sp. CCMP2592]|nr:unnamed protein product [Symbiodinium sp. CCMP2592]
MAPRKRPASAMSTNARATSSTVPLVVTGNDVDELAERYKVGSWRPSVSLMEAMKTVVSRMKMVPSAIRTEELREEEFFPEPLHRGPPTQLLENLSQLGLANLNTEDMQLFHTVVESYLYGERWSYHEIYRATRHLLNTVGGGGQKRIIPVETFARSFCFVDVSQPMLRDPVLEDHQVERPENVSQRSWSRRQSRQIEKALPRVDLCESADQVVAFAATILKPMNLETFLHLHISDRDDQDQLCIPFAQLEATVWPQADHEPLPRQTEEELLLLETELHDRHLEALFRDEFDIELSTPERRTTASRKRTFQGTLKNASHGVINLD